MVLILFLIFLFTASSALILKTETEDNRLSSLSGDNFGSEVRRGVGFEDAVADFSTPVMDSAQLKEPDYVVGQCQHPSNKFLLKFISKKVYHDCFQFEKFANFTFRDTFIAIVSLIPKVCQIRDEQKTLLYVTSEL